MTARARPGGRGTFVPAFLVLAAVSLAGLLAFYALIDFVPGRDSDMHVRLFYESFAPTERIYLPLLLANYVNYGPVLKVLTFAVRSFLGDAPLTFGATNFVVFLLTCLLLARTLRRLGTDPAWGRVLGLTLLGTSVGLSAYYQYDVDAVYILAGLLAFDAILLSDRPRGSDLAANGAVSLFCLLVRLNALVYLIVPWAYWLTRWARSGDPASASPVGRRASRVLAAPIGRLAAAAALLAWSLACYLPLRGWIWQVLTHGQDAAPDFDVRSTIVAPGLWTWANWLWFPARLPRMFSPATLAVLAPLAAAGFWRGARGRRAWVLLYAAVPALLYSFVMGTRKVEYIGPTIALVVVFAVHGLAGLRRPGARLGIAALLLALAAGQAWWQLFGLPPCPLLPDRAAPNRLAPVLFAGPRGCMLFTPPTLDPEALPLALIPRLGRLVDAGGEVDLVSAARIEKRPGGWRASVDNPGYRDPLIGRFTPLFVSLPRGVRPRCFDAEKWKDHGARLVVVRWDWRVEAGNYDSSPALHSLRSRFAVIARLQIDQRGPCADVLIPR